MTADAGEFVLADAAWMRGLRVPKEWRRAKVKFLMKSMRAGDTITAEQIELSGNFPVYGANGVRGYTDRETHEGTYILIGRQGALCGNVHLVSGAFWASEHAIVAAPGRGTDPRWVAALLEVMNLGQYSTSAAQPGIGVGQIAPLTVYAPPLDEQRRIADFLNHETAQIDALIAKQEQLIEILRECRQSVVDHLIEQYDECWKPLRYLAGNVTVGIVIQPAQWYVDQGVPALRGLNVRPERVEASDLVYLSEEGDRAHSKSRLRAGDVVVVRTGQAGAAAVVPDEFDHANAIDLLIVRPGPDVRGEFLAMVLNAPATRTRSAQAVVGTIQGHLNVAALRALSVPAPPVEEQDRAIASWGKASAKIDALIAKAQEFIGLARERRAALITEAVMGRIDVAIGKSREGA